MDASSLLSTLIETPAAPQPVLMAADGAAPEAAGGFGALLAGLAALLPVAPAMPVAPAGGKALPEAGGKDLPPGIATGDSDPDAALVAEVANEPAALTPGDTADLEAILAAAALAHPAAPAAQPAPVASVDAAPARTAPAAITQPVLAQPLVERMADRIAVDTSAPKPAPTPLAAAMAQPDTVGSQTGDAPRSPPAAGPAQEFAAAPRFEMPTALPTIPAAPQIVEIAADLPRGQGVLPALTPAPAARDADVAMLVDRLAAARAAAQPADVQLAIDHADFGEIGLRFRQDDRGALSVSLSAEDRGLELALASASAPRGEGNGGGGANANARGSDLASHTSRGGMSDHQSGGSPGESDTAQHGRRPARAAPGSDRDGDSAPGNKSQHGTYA